jgi:hypothetical protein
VIFPVVSEVTLKNLVKEYKSTGNAYREKVYTVMRSSYGGYYRRILPLILNKLEFRSNNEVHRPVIQVISILKKYADSKQRYYDAGKDIPIDGVLRSGWQEIILETGADDEIKVNRINYELSVLQALREKLRCKEIWVVGANRYRNPEEDLPADFEAQRLEYFQALKQPSDNDAYPNLQPILTRAINWDLIRQQYDQMVKYATALRLGMAETEAILKRFTRGNLLHPTYQALAELGKAVKTIFLCKYLHSVDLRQEINAGLNVVENWNSANSFIFYGKGGEIATNRLSDQELTVLSLHLLQISLVYINTLMIQEVLSQPQWMKLMKLEDLRALSPLIWGHVNPYGTFRFDLNVRLPIEMG